MGFFTFEQSFLCLLNFFQIQKTLYEIFYHVFEAGSGSALKKQLDPDPH